MTAEVAVLNKIGIALAADSMVSVGDKIYNTTNKLFALSKYQPVGVLIWGATELNLFPLEIIIKEFREFLGKREFSSLKEYGSEFVKFVQRKVPFSSEGINSNFVMAVQSVAEAILKEFIGRCSESGLDLEYELVQNSGRATFDGIIKDISAEARRSRLSRSLQGLTENVCCKSGASYQAPSSKRLGLSSSSTAPTSASFSLPA